MASLYLLKSTPVDDLSKAKIGKAALDNPDLPIDFVRDMLIALQEDPSLAEPFIPEE